MSGSAKVVDDEGDDGGVAGAAGNATTGNQLTEIARLDTIITHVDGIETKQDAGNASVASIDGKLPATAAGADAVANPTLSKVFAYLQSFNGTTWDRTKQVLANVASDALTDWAVTVPIVGAANVAWDSAAAKWRRLVADANGSLKSRLFDSAGVAQFADAAAPGDAAANAENTTSIRARLSAFNGATWDRVRQGVTGAITAFTGYVNVLPVAVYRATRNTTVDGGGQELQANARGDLAVAEQFRIAGENPGDDLLNTHHKGTASQVNALSIDLSAAAEASSVTKASAGRVYKVVMHNNNAAARYLQFFNSTTVPADAAVPAMAFNVPANSSITIDWPQGMPFATGIAWCNSTTLATKTVGAADFFGTVWYA